MDTIQQIALINSILQSENKIFKTKSQNIIESFQIARCIYYILSKSGPPFQVSYRPSTTPTGGLSTDSIHMYGCDAVEQEHHYQRQRPLSNNPIWRLEPSLCWSPQTWTSWGHVACDLLADDQGQKNKGTHHWYFFLKFCSAGNFIDFSGN
jgi:hypothetical protein